MKRKLDDRLRGLEQFAVSRISLPRALARRLAGSRARREPGDTLHRDDLELIEWALRRGLSYGTAAELIGDDSARFAQRLADDPDLAARCRRAIAEGKALVAARVFDRIQQGEAHAAMQWLRARAGEFSGVDGLGSVESAEPDARFA